MPEQTFTISNKSIEKESIRIHPKKAISANLRMISFVDKDTQQKVVYIPTLDVSGYGETDEKAIQILRFSVHEYFTYLMTLSPKNLDSELRQLGWKRSKFSSKQFSKIYVDSDGELKNFNAVPETVKHLSLQSA